MIGKRFPIALTLLALTLAGPALSMELDQSLFDRELHRIRYEMAFQSVDDSAEVAADKSLSLPATVSVKRLNLKSPGKAFFYSLAVPGLGQFYYGSRIKPLLFVSVEVASWAMYFKWHGQGDDLTAGYEDFNRAHWYRSRYKDFLQWTYGQADDNSIPGLTEHLPDSRTQQYYEMTGKYDQFAWGWDDARLAGDSLYSFDSASPPPSILEAVPYSARRFEYENMRNNANKKYDRATRMIFVSIANRLISAFEAYFVVRARNNKMKRETWGLERLKVRTRLKSYYSHWDTPFVTFAYKF